MQLALTGIGRLVTFDDDDRVLTGAAVLLDAEGDRVVWLGPERELPAAPPGEVREVLDCGGRAVLPGLVDCHTHLVFAGDRRDEFARRAAGATYAEIQAAGGGIRRTVALTRAASEEELLLAAARRAEAMLRRGVTTVEIKSGYGLALEPEQRMLRVARRLAQVLPLRVMTTFLGAHTVPPEYQGRRDAYVDLVVDELLPTVAHEGLADFCDVFCEAGAFSLEDSRRILEAGRRYGLRPKLHADQLTRTGATALGVALGAVSVDHLEEADASDAALLGQHPETVAVLLPASVLFLGARSWPPGHALLAAGAKVALATDMNPGSSMCDDLPLMTTLACTRLGFSPHQALRAVTRGGAEALGRDDLGRIAVGARADLCVVGAEHEEELPYRFGAVPPFAVVSAGRVVLGPGRALTLDSLLPVPGRRASGRSPASRSPSERATSEKGEA